MKFYALIICFILISGGLFAQDSKINNKSELPQIKKESLQISLDVELYPNPADEFLNVRLKNSNLKEVKIEMFNVIGNKLDIEIDQINASDYKVNVKEFNPGYYLLIINDPLSRFNKAFKFRKQ
jgi:hypothetical protein